MAPRILLLSAPFGSGHLQAARAIGGACTALDPACVAETIDLESPVLHLASAGYLTLLSHAPSAYRSLYHARTGGLPRLIRSLLGPAVRKAIQQVRPTAIIATHPFPAAAAAAVGPEIPLAMAVTDFVPHPLWANRGADRYFVASTEAAHRLQSMGVPGDRILATGIPVRPEFSVSTPPRPRDGTRRVLVMGGGLGLGPITETIRSLAVLPHRNLRVTVVCGQNQSLRQELQDLFRPDPRIETLGYTREIPALMARADLLVTKPGGVSCSEALASGLPMLLLPPLPGHEEENAAYLAGSGAAAVTNEFRVGEEAAALLFREPERLAFMREAARRIGNPAAAFSIANETFILSTRNGHAGITAR